MKKEKRKSNAARAKKGKTACAAAYALTFLFYDVTKVSASAVIGTVTTGIPQIDSALSTIKNLFLGLLSVIGIIIMVKCIGDTAQAYQQQDSHGMYDGAKGIAAGAVMTFIGAILALLGI